MVAVDLALRSFAMAKTPLSFLCILLALFARSVSGGPLEELQPGEWYEVPNSRLDAHKPNPTPPGAFPNIINAWSSGAFDTKRERLLVWGGGHCDYAGNEIYAFDMHTLTWSRIWGPTPNELIPSCQEAVQLPGGGAHTYSDGNPSPRHTYDSLEYIPEPIDGLLEVGGAAWGGSGGGAFLFSFKTGDWRELDKPLQGRLGNEAVYDRRTQRYFMRARNRVLELDLIGNEWAEHGNACPAGCSSDRTTAELDPTRNLIVFVGDGDFAIYNIATGQHSEPVTRGATEIESTDATGLAYDPSSDLIVAWGGHRGARPQDVYTMDLRDLGDLQWNRVIPAASNTVIPSSMSSKGTYGRFRYSPTYNVFVLYNHVSENVFIYKLGDSIGTPDNIPPDAPSSLQVQ